MQNILLPTDGSTGAERATEVAAKLAKAMGGRLSILTAGGNLFGDEMKQLARVEGDNRNAQVEANNIQISVKDGKVTLDGKIRAWYERGVIEQAAWSAPGVTQVEDNLIVN